MAEISRGLAQFLYSNGIYFYTVSLLYNQKLANDARGWSSLLKDFSFKKHFSSKVIRHFHGGGGLQFFFPLLQAEVTVGKPFLEPHAAASGSSGWLHRTEK